MSLVQVADAATMTGPTGDSLTVGLLAIFGGITLWVVLRRQSRTNRHRDAFAREYRRLISQYNLDAKMRGEPGYWIDPAAQMGPDDPAWQLAQANVINQAYDRRDLARAVWHNGGWK